MSNLNLLPCPLCNLPAKIEVTRKGDFLITCTDCDCVHGPVRSKLNSAAALWNKLCTGSCNLESIPTSHAHHC